MFSGGISLSDFNPFNYEACIGDYCTSLDTVAEQYSAANNFFREALEEAYVTSDDPLGNFVDNFTAPERAIGKVALSILGAGCGGNEIPTPDPRKETTPLAERKYLREDYVNYDELADKSLTDYYDEDLGACRSRGSQESFEFWGSMVHGGIICSDHPGNFTGFFGAQDTCSFNAWRIYNPDHKDVICGRNILETDGFWTWSDTPASFWSFSNGLNDDDSRVWSIIKLMEATRLTSAIPGWFFWPPNLVEATEYLNHTANLLVSSRYPDVRAAFLEDFKKFFEPDYTLPRTPLEYALEDNLRRLPFNLQDLFKKLEEAVAKREKDVSDGKDQTIIEADDVLIGQIQDDIRNRMNEVSVLMTDLSNNNPDAVQRYELVLMNMTAAAGVKYPDMHKFDFDFTWRDIDWGTPGRAQSNRIDWATPLAGHAASLYFQTAAIYHMRWDELSNADSTGKIDTGEWWVELDEQDNIILVMGGFADPATGLDMRMSIRQYANDYIWRRAGETKETIRTEILKEINGAVQRSYDRCPTCADDHYWSRLLLEYIQKMNDGIAFDFWPLGGQPIHGEETLRDRIRQPHVVTPGECCHEQSPARMFVEATQQCNMQMTAAEWCFSQNTPPQVLNPEDCSCEPCPDGQATTTGLAGSCVTPQGEPVHTIRCGDHVVEGREQCDDGNTNNNDGCRNDCTRNAVPPPTIECGNGRVERGEECDGTPNCDDNCKIVVAPPPPPPPACREIRVRPTEIGGPADRAYGEPNDGIACVPR